MKDVSSPSLFRAGLSVGVSHDIRTGQQASEQDSCSYSSPFSANKLTAFQTRGVDQAVLPKQLKISSVNFYCCHILHWHVCLHCSINLVRAGDGWDVGIFRTNMQLQQAHWGVAVREWPGRREHLAVFRIASKVSPRAVVLLGRTRSVSPSSKQREAVIPVVV